MIDNRLCWCKFACTRAAYISDNSAYRGRIARARTSTAALSEAAHTDALAGMAISRGGVYAIRLPANDTINFIPLRGDSGRISPGCESSRELLGLITITRSYMIQTRSILSTP